MADDDDDDSFGEFTFASNQTTVNSSSQIPVTTADDDDWGDFSFIRNNATDHNLKSPQPQPQPQPLPHPQPEIQTPTPPKWEKIKGALPLSLFGGDEDEEDEEQVMPVAGGNDVKQSSFTGNSGFASNKNNDKSNSQLGINDLIANLYGPRQQQLTIKADDNGNGLDFTLTNSPVSTDPVSKSDSFFNLHAVAASANHGSDDEGGWEFIDAFSDSKLQQNGKDSKVHSEKPGLQDGSHGSTDLSGPPNNGVFVESHVTDSGLHSKPITNIQNGFTFDITADSKGTTTNESNSNPPGGSVDLDDGFGDFETAFMEHPSKKKVHFEKPGLQDGSHGSADLFGPPNNGVFVESHVTDSGLDSKPITNIQNGFTLDTKPDSKYTTTNESNSNPPGGSLDIDDGFGEFETAFMEHPLKKKEVFEGSNSPLGLHDASHKPVDLFSFPNKLNLESHKENNGFDFTQTEWNKSQDVSVTQAPSSDENFGKFEISFSEVGSKPEGSEPSSKNYKQPVPLSIFGIEEEPEVESSFNLQHELFKSSSHGKHMRTHSSNLSISDILSDLYSQSEPISSANHEHNPDEKKDDNDNNNDDDDDDDNFDDGSWEFKDASSESRIGNQELSFKGKLNNFIDFYSKLKDELSIVARNHLHGLKVAQSTATLAGDEMKVDALNKEIQEASNQLHQKDIVSSEVHTDRVISLEKYIKTLNEPDYLIIDSEYQISTRLSLAESDLKTAIDLINHITTLLKILTLAPKGEPRNYVTEWFKVISVCSQELKHGSWIWKQSLQKNIHSEILSEHQGKQFITALGEIYRAVVILGAAFEFYKPWILLSGEDLEGCFGLLKECCSLWSTSGLEEVTPEYLLKSIKSIQNLDQVAIANEVLSQSQCQLSLLSPEVVPEMKMVIWNGDAYFVTLANLWANLVSPDPPNLSIRVV